MQCTTETPRPCDKSQSVWKFPNLKSAVLTGLPWDRKYVHPFRSALISSSELQVSSSICGTVSLAGAHLYVGFFPTGSSFATFRRLQHRHRLHAK